MSSSFGGGFASRGRRVDSLDVPENETFSEVIVRKRRKMKVDDFALFVEIVERGSLAAAGRSLGLAPATVSERLSAFERHYGATLLQRTTRSLHLTDEGRLVLEGARRVLHEATELESRVRLGSEALSGPVRISAPVDLGHGIVASTIDRFLAAHPNIAVELVLFDGYVDVVGEGLDLAVRFGELADSSLRVRKLGRHRRVVCAAPSYLSVRGEPAVPSDLADHSCLLMRFGQHLDNVWRFREGERVVVKSHRTTNDSRLVRRWCTLGFGLAWKSVLDVGAELEAGELVEVLADYAAKPTPVQIVFPPSRTKPRRVEALAEALQAAFAAEGAP